jgi:RimJ/RimL family protein N-acetyltransferase
MLASVRLDLTPTAYLTPLDESDVTQAYVDGLNDPVVHRFLVGPRSRVQTPDLVRGFVRANRDDAHAILFGLFVDGRLRGTARLHDIGRDGAYLGLAIFDRGIWGQGWGSRMVDGVTRYAIGELGLPAVRAVIEEENLASRRAFEKSGYVHRTADDVIQDGMVKQLWEFSSNSRRQG